MATRADIAKLAGVSTATVSRVINNPEVVGPKLKARVMKAVTELEYTPNLTAKSLKTKKSYNIAYLIPDIVNPYYSEIYKGINMVAADRGYICSLIEEVSGQWLNRLLLQRFDGIICAVDLSMEIRALIKKMGIPTVIQTEVKEDWGLNKSATVSHNLEKVFPEAFKYIYDRGHRRIALIIHRTNPSIRKALYTSALKNHGLHFDPSLIVEYKEQQYHFKEGYQAMKQLIEQQSGATAVLVQNDLAAAGAMCAAWEQGLKIPEDVSFLGCDDTAAARYSIPPLSTIKRYKEKQGKQSARMLFDLLEDKPVENYEFKASLIIRDSISTIGKAAKISLPK